MRSRGRCRPQSIFLALLVFPIALAGCAKAPGPHVNCGADTVYVEYLGERQPLLNCAGVAVGTAVTLRVGGAASVHMVGGGLPPLTSSDLAVLTVDGETLRGDAVGRADVLVEASTLCGSAAMTRCTLAHVSVTP